MQLHISRDTLDPSAGCESNSTGVPLAASSSPAKLRFRQPRGEDVGGTGPLTFLARVAGTALGFFGSGLFTGVNEVGGFAGTEFALQASQHPSPFH